MIGVIPLLPPISLHGVNREKSTSNLIKCLKIFLLRLKEKDKFISMSLCTMLGIQAGSGG